MELLQTALNYHNQGLQLLPIKHQSKEPLANWKKLQYTPETLEFVNNNFNAGNKNIGIICGAISKNFSVIDFDNKKQFDKAYKISKHLKNIIDKTPIIETARGFHVYLRTDKTLKSKKYNAYDIDFQSSGKYVIAPPSLHPSGQLYLFQDGFKDIYKLNDLSEIDFIDLEYSKTDIINNTDLYLPETNYNTLGLGQRLFNYLITGNIQENKSRSELEYQIVLKLISNGCQLGEIQETFRRFAYAGSKVKQQAKYNYLETELYPKALEYYNNHIPENHKIINELSLTAPNYLSNPRTYFNDIAVYFAILNIAKTANKIKNIDLACRELALKTNISAKTIYHALNRLSECGLLKQTKKGKTSKPSKYNLIDKITHTNTHIYCNSMLPFVNEALNINFSKDTNNNYFTRKCLGKNGYLVVNEINKTFTDNRFKITFTISEIAEKTGLNYRTVNRLINKLHKYNLLHRGKEGKTYLFCLPNKKLDNESLELLSQYSGTYQKKEKLAKRIEAERKQNRNKIKRYTEAKQKEIEPDLIN